MVVAIACYRDIIIYIVMISLHMTCLEIELAPDAEVQRTQGSEASSEENCTVQFDVHYHYKTNVKTQRIREEQDIEYRIRLVDCERVRNINCIRNYMQSTLLIADTLGQQPLSFIYRVSFIGDFC